MRSVFRSRLFKKESKLAKKRGKNMDKLETVLLALVSDMPLPSACRPHKLVGQYADLWECHIEPDWLLIYDYDDNEVRLYRTGTHADLFE